MPRATLIRPLAISAFLLCLVVVVLGAYVRGSDAGLGCPDWPGCYGHVTPAGAIAAAQSSGGMLDGATVDAGKAWKEMVHRYAAGTLGVLIILIAALAIQTRTLRIVSLPYAATLVGLVIVQGMLGMLTVTERLHPAIVTAHLLLGLTTLSVLWWLVLTLGRRQASAWRGSTAFLGSSLTLTRRIALLGLLTLGLQLALGGWTSSHYAATGCPDFPKCQDQWWPGFQGNVGIHFAHRLGALFATLMLVLAAARVLRSRSDPFARRAALAVLAALGLQLAIGVTLVKSAFPLWLATAHNAGAALLLLAVVALNRSLRPAWKAS
ncbi:MAG TPA: COX15/CtaA family protein [Steroidobacteraceae bacterium]|nr:COX15/CtaA family protein [Steroidobacteraceae bacterium]